MTKDGDFAAMVATSREAPPLVWVRIGNTRRVALLEWFEPLIEQIVDMASQVSTSSSSADAMATVWVGVGARIDESDSLIWPQGDGSVWPRL